MTENLTPSQVLSILNRVNRLADKLGDSAGAEFKWLAQFARVLTEASEDNYAVLWPAAAMLIVKYRLLERLE